MLVADSGLALSATSTGTVTLNGGILSAGPAGGMISGPVVAGSGGHYIVPGFVSPSGYATLNLFGGLTTNGNTYLEFHINTGSQIGTGGNGLPIFGGDLINLGNSALTVWRRLRHARGQPHDGRRLSSASLTAASTRRA